MSSPPADAPGTLGAQITDEMRRHRAALRAGPRTLRQWVKWIVLGTALVFAIEGALSTTAVITPIDPWFLNGMRAVGAVLGIALAWTAPAIRRGPRGQRVAGFVIAIALCGYLFNAAAWRIADWWLFTGSAAGWETAHYPLVAASQGRGAYSATVSIDPYGLGDATEIPIPREQHAQVSVYPRRHCVAVHQRRNASGAVEIRTAGAIASNVQPVTIRACNPGGG